MERIAPDEDKLSNFINDPWYVEDNYLSILSAEHKATTCPEILCALVDQRR
ncbi:MAG: hypothetical protein GKR95_15870 [Gammaproteobacteria bacterium]|nr:hypothetical protein [Gammaproteobacteria bacterium]